MRFFSQEYFGKFGELDSVKLKMDPMTGNLNIYGWFFGFQD